MQQVSDHVALPATLAEQLPDRTKPIHQAVRDLLASLFGGASDE
jgi:hypothetical protein